MADQDNQKPKKQAKVKFGDLLILDGDRPWTVESSEGDEVVVTSREGDRIERRTISREEFEAAKAQPLPSQFREHRAPKGISIGAFLGSRRVIGYDAGSRSFLVESDQGPRWIARGQERENDAAAMYDDTSDRGVSGSGITKVATGKESSQDETGGTRVDRWARSQVSDLTYGLLGKKGKSRRGASASSVPATPPPPPVVPVIPVSSAEEEPSIEVSEVDDNGTVVDRAAARGLPTRPATSSPDTKPSVVVSKTVVVGDAPVSVPVAPPAVSVSRTVKVGGAEPSIRETRAQIKADIEAVAPAAKPSAPRSASASATVSAELLAGPASALSGQAGAQRVLFARAANALNVMNQSVASQRGEIQQLQQQAAALRETMSQMNNRPPDAEQGDAYRVQARTEQFEATSKELGALNNRLAMARHQLQLDEAAALRLQIGMDLMRSVAPTVAAGRLPSPIVTLVKNSIPEGIPDPNQAVMAAHLAEIAGESPADTASRGLMPSAASTISRGQTAYAALNASAKNPSLSTDEKAEYARQAERLKPYLDAVRELSTEDVMAGNVPTEILDGLQRAIPEDFGEVSEPRAREHVEGIMGRRDEERAGSTPAQALKPPLSAAASFAAAQQSDRIAGGYQEGLGSPDAYQASMAAAGAESRPVISTSPASYTAERDATAEEEAQDIYDSGRTSAEFMRQQQASRAAQEQFLPGTTPSLAGPQFEKEAQRVQGVRTPEEAQAPEDDAARASAYNAMLQRQRVAAAQASLMQDRSKEEETAQAMERVRQQAESLKRNVSRIADLFNGSLGVATAPTIVLALFEFAAVLWNMNSRVLVAFVTYRNKKSILRKIFPPAQVPIEAAGVIALDLMILSFVFIKLCIMILPVIIASVFLAGGAGIALWAMSS